MCSEHPCIAQLYGTLQTNCTLFFLFEPLLAGNVAAQLAAEKRLPFQVTQNYLAQVICGVEHLHSNNIIHRDIRPRNLLLHHSGRLKLAGFALAKIATQRTSSIVACREDYRAPEMLKGLPYNSSVDWWAIGCVLYEMALGVAAFGNPDPRVQTSMILNAKCKPIEHGTVDKLTKTTLLQFFKKEPHERLGCCHGGLSFVKKLPFFRGVEWTRLSSSSSAAAARDDVSIQVTLVSPVRRSAIVPAIARPQLIDLSSLLLPTTDMVEEDKTRVDKYADALFSDF